MFALPLFGLYAANKWADQRDKSDLVQHEPQAPKTSPFGLPQSAFQRGNKAGAHFPRTPYFNQTQQPIKYDPPGQVGAGRSHTILRDAKMDRRDWDAIDNMRNQIYQRDVLFTGWNNSDNNWRIVPQARSWPITEQGAEFYIPFHFDPHTGSGFGDWDHRSYLGAQHPPKEIFSHGPVSTVSWSYMDGPSKPRIMRQLD